MKRALIFGMLWMASLLIPAHAQDMHCMMVRIPEAQFWQNAYAVVWGRVLSANSFYNDTRSRIYTRYAIELQEVFKGTPPASVEVICEGGSVGNLSLEFSDRIVLEPGAQVALALTSVPKHWTGIGNTSQAFAVYASLQGVFQLDAFGHLNDVFHRYQTLSELRRALQTHTGIASRLVGNQAAQLPDLNPSVLAVVNSLSPTTIVAGEGNILTISGSGFGAVRGAGFVTFTSASGNALQPLAKDYVSWTDAQIRVRVPSRLVGGAADNAAATGPVTVTPAGGVAVNAGNITVPYAFFNRFNATNDSAVIMNVCGPNGSGGFTLTYNTAFAGNAAAVASFERALDTWRCASGINIVVGPGTSAVNAIAPDGVNIVTFDDANPLDPGVGGRAENWVLLCTQNGQNQAVTLQMDIRFDNAAGGFTWNFGPGAPAANAVDFQTVALHELGHNVQLAHTRSTSAEVMAASSVVGSSRRSLTANDITAALNVVQRGLNTFCNNPPHQANQPAISVSATTAMPVCSNGTIGFAAQATGLNTTSLVWRVNGANQTAGAGTNAFTYTSPQNNAQITCGVAGCSTTLSNTLTAAVQTLSNATFAYPVTSSCTSQSGTVLPSSISNSGGTFSATPAGLSLNASTGAITPSASIAGTYTVTYAFAASGPCPAVSFNRSMTIVAAPGTPTSITGLTTGNCNANRAFSCPAVAGASSYQWTLPAGVSFVGASNTSSITATFPNNFSSGTISVRSVNASGCTSAARSITVSGAPAASAGIQVTAINTVARTATCTTAAITGATSYTWSVTNGTLVSGQGTRTVQIGANVGATSVTACVKVGNSCGNSAQTCRTVSFPVLMVSETKESTVVLGQEAARISAPTLYPNPVEDILNVQFDSEWDHCDIQMDLVDMQGRVQPIGRFVSEQSANVEYTTSHLQPGIYLLKVQGKNAVQYVRFVKL